MDVRLAIAFARRLDAEAVNVTVAAAGLGVARETFYVYERRFRAEGLAGLVPRSRAAGSHPNRTPAEVEEQIVDWHQKLLSSGQYAGARSVWARMRRAGQPCPSARTVHRVLARRGLTQVQPQKRPRASYRRFSATAPNGIWQLDGTSTWLADGTEQVVLRVLDDHSRKALASRVTATETAEAAWAVLSTAIDRHGPPAMFLSDNSLAFNGSRQRVEVLVERRLRELGVAVVPSSAHHPQTCGKAEREHQTFDRWLAAQPAPETPQQLQRLCQAYDAIYNQRPHQSLGDGTTTPDEAYAASAKARPAPGPLPAAARLSRVKVSARGEVGVGAGIRVQLGRGWQGTVVDVVRDGNSVAVFHHHELVDNVIIDPTRRYQPNHRPPGGTRQPRHAGAPQA